MRYVSRTLSISALVAATISLFLRQQQARAAQMVDARARHFELMKLMLEHPELDYNNSANAGRRDRRTETGMSLWVAHWNTLWHIDKMDEKALRFNLADLFANPLAREWWRKVSDDWSSKESRRERRFIKIVTEECDNSVATPSTDRPLVHSAMTANPESVDAT